MRAFLMDLKLGARSLLKRPGVSVVAVLSLGVGVGVATTAFSLLNALALRDLPGIVEQDRLVTLGLGVQTEEGRGGPVHLVSWPDVEVLASRSELFEGVAAAGRARVALSVGGEPVVEDAEVVSANYFQLLGTTPHRGRLLGGSDAVPGSGSVVLSYGLWEWMGEPEDVVGRSVAVNGRAFTVVGVAPAGFTGMLQGDVVDDERAGPGLWVSRAEGEWIRPHHIGDPRSPDARWLHAVARLRAGVTPERLDAGLPGVARALERAMPDQRPDVTMHRGTLHFGPGDGANRHILIIGAFMVLPLLVLLIAAANAANLLLARNAERRQELAVRAALGAGRGALVRQILAESALLALASAALGLLVAQWSRSIAGVFALRLSMSAPIDLRVFLFTFTAAVGAGLLLGLFPALAASRPDVQRVLNASGRTTGGRNAARLRGGLVTAQVALSVILLVFAGLFVRSARNGLTVPTGLEEEGLVLATLDLDILHYDAPEALSFWDRLVEGVRGLPGVEAAALAEAPPLAGLPRDRVAASGEVEYGELAGVARVGDGYFRAAGIELLAGRAPGVGGERGGEVVVNRALARRLWPRGDPLGRTLRVGAEDGGGVVTVVGLAADARSEIHAVPDPVLYMPLPDEYSPRGTLYVRSDEATTPAAIRDVVRRLDPRLPLHTVATARALRARQLVPWRLTANALAALGAIALALAVTGLYGVLAFSVARRSREIGIRMAMGATRGGVVRTVLRESLSLVVAGLAIGGLLAGSAAVLMRAWLFGVSPLDPVTWGGLLGLLLVVGAAAAAVPARRAASVEPVRALAD